MHTCLVSMLLDNMWRFGAKELEEVNEERCKCVSCGVNGCGTLLDKKPLSSIRLESMRRRTTMQCQLSLEELSL